MENDSHYPIVDSGDKKGHNRHQHLKVVTETFNLVRHQHRCNLKNFDFLPNLSSLHFGHHLLLEFLLAAEFLFAAAQQFLKDWTFCCDGFPI